MKKLKLLLVFSFAAFLVGCSSGDVTEKLAKKIEILSLQLENNYSRIIRENPGREGPKMALANFYYQDRKYKEATEVLKHSSSRKSRVLLAKSYSRLSDYTRALDIFDRLEKLSDSEALYLYGLSLEKKNLFNKAKDVYEKVDASPYLERAQQRIKSFKNKFGDTFPNYLKEIISKAPNSEDYPNASSIVLLSDEKINIKDDNKYISTLHVIVKVFNDKGRKEWGELEIGYDSTYERVELDFARTVTPEKEIVYAGEKNLRDVSKYLNFPLYSNARVFIVSMPQVLQGSIIEYRVKIYTNKLINEDKFSFRYRLKESIPVKKGKFLISLPEKGDVKFSVVNEEYIPEGIQVNPEIKYEGGKKKYLFEFTDIPQLLSESHMVPASEVNPAIMISSFSSWSEFYEWWKDLYVSQLILSPEMKEFLADLIKGAESDFQKAQKIYEFCADKIRYVAVEYGEAGFEPHKVTEVFLNKYGDCKDQAILLVSLLREAGLEAWPVLIPTKSAYNIKEELPASYFNHAIACVRLEGELIFMDPTSSTTSFGILPSGDQNRKTLVFFDEDYEIINTPLTGENFLQKEMDIKIDKKEVAHFNRRVTAGGSYASSQRYFLEYTPPYLIENTLQEKMKGFSVRSELIDFNVKDA